MGQACGQGDGWIEASQDLDTSAAPDDHALMAALAKGDHGAFEQLVSRHQRTAWRVAYCYFGRKCEAEDIVQDAFLRIFDAAPRYKPAAAFGTYLCRIVTRLCIDRARKRGPIPVVELPDCPDASPRADESLLESERSRSVRKALALLPPNQRVVVILRYFQGLGYREMADVLRTTPKSIERMLARARSNLKKILKRDFETGS